MWDLRKTRAEFCHPTSWAVASDVFRDQIASRHRRQDKDSPPASPETQGPQREIEAVQTQSLLCDLCGFSEAGERQIWGLALKSALAYGLTIFFEFSQSLGLGNK